MLQIALRFGFRGNAEFPGHGTGSQTEQLWKYEPNPVRFLPARRQFAPDFMVDLFLSCYEFIQLRFSRHVGRQSYLIKR